MTLIILGEAIVIAVLLVLLSWSRRDLNEAVRALDSLLKMTNRSPYADYGDYAVDQAERIVKAHYDIQ